MDLTDLEYAVRDRRAEIESARRMPADLIDALRGAGVFRATVPKRFGGDEIEFLEWLRAIEGLARADGSAGWAATRGAIAVLLARLPESTQRELYSGGPDVVAACGLFPPQQAVVEPEGYRVTGRWPFASNSDHASVVLGGCLVSDRGVMRVRPNGVPEVRVVVTPAADVTVLDTWFTSGLAGTGSNDIVIDDVFVPEDSTFALGADATVPGALYAINDTLFEAFMSAAVAVGIAREALDDMAALAASRVPATGTAPLATSPYVASNVAEAEAKLRSARSWLYEMADECAATAEGGSARDRGALMHLATSHAVAVAAEVTTVAYTLAGGASPYSRCPLQRYFRDAHVVTQHAGVSRQWLGPIGTALMGGDPGPAVPW